MIRSIIYLDVDSPKLGGSVRATDEVEALRLQWLAAKRKEEPSLRAGLADGRRVEVAVDRIVAIAEVR